MELIEHLEHIREELYKLIEISEEGEVVHNDSLRHDIKMARELITELENIVQLNVDRKKSVEIEKVLAEFVQRFRKCF